MSEMCYYVDIENFPLYNWEKCQSGDLTYSRIDRNNTECSEEQDKLSWELINYDYVDRFGVSRKHARMISLSKRRLILQLELATTGNNFLKNEISDIDDEMENIFKQDKFDPHSIDRTLIHLSKAQGFKLNKRDLMTLEYFIMVQEYSKKN